MSPLGKFLAETGETITDFARRGEFRDATVSRWAAGHHIPRRGARAKIAELTNGVVSPTSWLECEDAA